MTDEFKKFIIAQNAECNKVSVIDTDEEVSDMSEEHVQLEKAYLNLLQNLALILQDSNSYIYGSTAFRIWSKIYSSVPITKSSDIRNFFDEKCRLKSDIDISVQEPDLNNVADYFSKSGTLTESNRSSYG